MVVEGSTLISCLGYKDADAAVFLATKAGG